ncbi:MAG: histidinol-phosphate transaminase [Coriobacteriales bacterium]|jgi:histidinol-phosphate aminotransferase|nr:histidinol-phosphate transaminase [Coriobacteriales bacterium]
MDWNTFFIKELEQLKAYQPGLRVEQVKQQAAVDEVYKLSSNESPYPPFASAIAAMQGELEGLNQYPDGASTELREALAARYGVDFNQVTVASGSNSLLMDLATSCLHPGNNVVYCWPSFVVYRMSAQLTGAEYRELPLRADGVFDLDAILAAIDADTKIVYLCSPNNPTGGAITKPEFAAFLDKLPEQVLLVIDQAYQEFATDPAALDAMDFFDDARPLVVLRTFSKMYAMAGARVGYGIAPAPVIEAVDKIRTPFNVNSVAQAGALAALGDGEELERRRADNARGRQQLLDCFARLGLKTYPSEANFVWVFLDDAQAVFDKLLTHGIIVRNFAADGGLRIGVGDAAGVAATVQTFEEMFA